MAISNTRKVTLGVFGDIRDIQAKLNWVKRERDDVDGSEATVNVEADTGKATVSLDKLREKLSALSTRSHDVNVGADDKEANAKLDALKYKLTRLEHTVSQPRVSVVGATKAMAELSAIDLALDKIDNRRATARVAAPAPTAFPTTGAALGAGIAGAVAQGLAMLPALGAAGGAGLMAALGGAVLAGTPKVKSAFSKMATESLGTLRNSFAPLIPYLTGVAGQVVGIIRGIAPQIKALASTIGPMLKPMVAGIGDALKGLLPGLITMMKAAQPAIQATADVIAKLGENLGKMFAAFAPAMGAASEILRSFGNAVTGLLPVIGEFAAWIAINLKDALVAVGPVLAKLIGAIADVLKPVLLSLKPVISMLIGVLDFFATGLSAIASGLMKIPQPLRVVILALPLLGAALWAISANPIIAIAGAIVMLVGVIVRYWPQISAFFRGIMDAVSQAWRFVVETTKRQWNAIAGFMKMIWAAITGVVSGAVNGIKGALGAAWRFISGGVRQEFNAIAGFFKGIWNAITGVFKNAVNGISGFLSRSWDYIRNSATRSFDLLKRGIANVWNAIQKTVGTPVYVVLRFINDPLLKGFNSILNFLHIPQIPLIPNVDRIPHFARGGRLAGYGGGDRVPALLEPGEAVVDKATTKRHARDLAAWGVPGFATGGLVWPSMWAAVQKSGIGGLSLTSTVRPGDGGYHGSGNAIDVASAGAGSTDPKNPMNRLYQWIHGNYHNSLELIHWPYGGIKNGKDVAGTFWGLDTWLSHKNHVHWAMPGGGKGLLGKIGDALKGALGAVGSFVVSTIDDIVSLVPAPVRNAINMIKGIAGTAGKLAFGAGGGMNNVVKGMLGKVTTGVRDWIVNSTTIGKFAQMLGLVSGTPVANVGSGVTRWTSVVQQALKLNGLSTNLTAQVLRQISSESGGDPNAVNRTDINAQMGDPSKGLLQVIGSTFRVYHVPGTSSNIFDPLANIAAAIHYAMHRYGPTLMRSGAGLGSGRGYDIGGILPPGYTLAYNGTGHNEVVVNPAMARRGGDVHNHVTVHVGATLASKQEIGREVSSALQYFADHGGKLATPRR